MGRRPVGRLLAAGGVLATLALLAPVTAGAEGTGADGSAAPARSVVATGRAQGFRATYTVPDYVIVSEFFDGGGPVTESVADSTGRATSFSSLPWPGENAVTAPGTLSAAMGRSVPLTYPFHVRADYPTTPSAEVHDPSGTYAISATASAGRASAAGAFGGGSGAGADPSVVGAFGGGSSVAGAHRSGAGSFGAAGGASGSAAGTSAVLDDGGVVRVVAETADTGLSIGDGLLRIAAVRSRSETTLAPGDAAPVTKSMLVIEGATVAGHPVTIAADGVHAADHAVPAPVGRGVSSDNELLGQAGLSVTVAPTGRPGSADALVITSRQVIPAPNNPKGLLVMRVGGASSEIIVGSADAAADAPAGAGESGTGPGSSSAPSSDGASAAGAAASVPGAAGPGGAGAGPSGPDGSAAPGGSPADGFGVPGLAAGSEGASAATVAAAAAAAAAAPAAVAAGLRPAPVRPDLATTGALFSLLAFGAVGLLLATRLHRFVKVRG